MLAAWKITQPRQVIVEGNDEIRVFESLSRHLSTRDLELQHYGGNKNLRRFLKTFSSSSDFGLVRSLAIVADANSNRNGREQQIRSALANAGLPVPSRPLEPVSNDALKVAYLIIPHNIAGTMIEDVCLESVKTDPAMECVDRYFEYQPSRYKGAEKSVDAKSAGTRISRIERTPQSPPRRSRGKRSMGI